MNILNAVCFGTLKHILLHQLFYADKLNFSMAALLITGEVLVHYVLNPWTESRPAAKFNYQYFFYQPWKITKSFP
jgi:hypothetical protein